MDRPVLDNPDARDARERLPRVELRRLPDDKRVPEPLRKDKEDVVPRCGAAVADAPVLPRALTLPRLADGFSAAAHGCGSRVFLLG